MRVVSDANIMSITSVETEGELEQALHEHLCCREQEKHYWQDTLEALEDTRMGRAVEGDKVRSWLESWGTGSELPVPIE